MRTAEEARTGPRPVEEPRSTPLRPREPDVRPGGLPRPVDQPPRPDGKKSRRQLLAELPKRDALPRDAKGAPRGGGGARGNRRGGGKGTPV